MIQQEKEHRKKIELMFDQGRKLYDQNQYEESLELFQSVLTEDPAHPYASVFMNFAKDKILEQEHIRLEEKLKKLQSISEMRLKKEQQKLEKLRGTTQDIKREASKSVDFSYRQPAPVVSTEPKTMTISVEEDGVTKIKAETSDVKKDDQTAARKHKKW